MENENKIPAGAAQQIETEQPDAGYPVTTMHGTPPHPSPQPRGIPGPDQSPQPGGGPGAGHPRDGGAGRLLPGYSVPWHRLSGKALDSFCKELLAQHIRTCVVDDLEAGRYESVDELVRVIQRLMK